jgi:hypothetical protein
MVPLSKSGLRLYRSVGSNPTLSASNRLRRGAGVAYQARLESACSRKATVGSNPTLSAIPLADFQNS